MGDLLRLATAGSVDDGKSTLVGRLLYDTKSVLTDQLAAVERVSRDRGFDGADLALLTLYLSALLAALTTLGTLALALLVSSLARGFGRSLGRRLPRLTSFVLAALALAYLGLWWRSHGGGAPVPQQAAFVAIGLAVAFLLGRFGANASVAVLSAGGFRVLAPEELYAPDC